jgi:hypothetical protein
MTASCSASLDGVLPNWLARQHGPVWAQVRRANYHLCGRVQSLARQRLHLDWQALRRRPIESQRQPLKTTVSRKL